MTRSDALRPRRGAPALLIALALGAALAGCTGDPTSSPADPAPDAGAGPAASAGGFPGLHVAGDVGILIEDETHLVLASTRSCDDLSAMLAAGQWRESDRLSLASIGAEAAALVTGFGMSPGSVLERGDRRVFAAVEGDPFCSATVADIAPGELTLEGPAMPGTSPGWAAAPRCYASAETGVLTLGVLFDTDARIGGQAQLTLVPQAEGYALDTEDGSSFTLNVLAHEGRLLRTMTAAFEQAGELPFRSLMPGPGFAADIDVSLDAGGRPGGTITLHGLRIDDGSFGDHGYDDHADGGYDDGDHEDDGYDEDGPSPDAGAVSLSFPFACGSVMPMR